MKTIGLTGGIGSGKSSVARIFSSLGMPVFYADASGKKVLESDAEVVKAVTELIGEEAFDEKGKANRAHIASIVFNDQSKLEALNAIIHPAVGRDFQQWKTQQKAVYCLREAAILFESGSHKDCEAVICVSAAKAVRVKRVMDRDQVSATEVEARMAKQMPQAEKEELSDFVIQNNGDESLISQVIKIHTTLISAL
jgi:dephospho-CoA kinase